MCKTDKCAALPMRIANAMIVDGHALYAAVTKAYHRAFNYD